MSQLKGLPTPPVRYSLITLAALTAAAAPAAAAISYTPIQFRQISGTRPFVEVSMNGKPFLFMVHSGADFYVMTTHANAASVGLADLQKTRNYGIASAGHVSDLGRAETKLARLQVGSSEAANASLSVFEAPQDPPMQGMLGVAWLRDKQVIVDYDAYRVGFPATSTDSRAEDERLIARGYVAHKMTWDSASRTFSVKGAVDGVATDLRVNTVSNNVVDTGFAQTAGIQLGPVVDQNGGPAGALVDSFLSKRQVAITVDGQDTAPTQPLIFDYYAYESGQRPAVPGKDGTVTIGAEFMLANRAVIDFGTQTLLIAPR
jgi:gag-polyprotein putative aspartyl protease